MEKITTTNKNLEMYADLNLFINPPQTHDSNSKISVSYTDENGVQFAYVPEKKKTDKRKNL